MGAQVGRASFFEGDTLGLALSSADSLGPASPSQPAPARGLLLQEACLGWSRGVLRAVGRGQVASVPREAEHAARGDPGHLWGGPGNTVTSARPCHHWPPVPPQQGLTQGHLQFGGSRLRKEGQGPTRL